MVDLMRLTVGALLLRLSWWVSLLGCALYRRGALLRSRTFRWLASTPTLTEQQRKELRRWA